MPWKIETGSALLCSVRRLLLLWGANCLGFGSVSFPLQIPPTFPNLLAPVPCL
ncbi:hypothetical protein SLEP1_g3089 [Rubroshorea leprosula]|uniref:Uncharacterized protein n=1 Tax=Rubroshorea leprosula TaxID=152421 RepID=A0AAV5HQ10_9ROSI|nr:hypothetical protein SLEP1_g3089 [Rubroshorea leprosula]